MKKIAQEEIHHTVNDYFEGIFYNDIEKLKNVFHKDALLFGSVNNQPYQKKLEEYLTVVKNRKSPYDSGESFKMEITGLELIGNICLVKASVPMLGFQYHDYLSLNKIDGKWLIVNKLFTNIA